ncbi:MAG: hypothetical protein IE922_07625 [Sphingomonadales bacterium]|nr:hypothetical protein [Sphingomonadales bacterium]
MSRRVSLNFRNAIDAEASGAIEVVLFSIEHDELEAPIRLSTDNADVISDEPRIYGTRSSWMGADPATEPYLWVLADALVPSDLEDAPASGQVSLELIDQEMAALVLSFVTRPSVSMAVVLASSPDLIEAEWTGLQIVSADIDTGSIVLSFGRDEIELEPWPAGRMTRGTFPGLHP